MIIDTSKKGVRKKIKGNKRNRNRQNQQREQQCAQYGDPEFVCFRIDQFEFFSKAQNFSQHSKYFKKVVDKQKKNAQEEEKKAAQEDAKEEEKKEQRRVQKPLQQIVMRLPKNTLPSDLHLVQKYIDNQLIGFFSDQSTAPDIETNFNVALIADSLKMRDLQNELLTHTILQQLNKTNVIKFLTPSHERHKKKKEAYKVEMVEVVSKKERLEKKKKRRERRRRKRKRHRRGNSSNSGSDEAPPSDSYDSCDDNSVDDSSSNSNSDSNDSDSSYSSSESESGQKTPEHKEVEIPCDEFEVIDEIKDLEATWYQFLTYCVDLTACNLQYITMTREEELIHTVHPDVIDMVVSKNIQFYQANPTYDNRSLIQLLLRVRKVNSVFELLKLEKEKVLKQNAEDRARDLAMNRAKEPLLVWSVEGITNYFYKQSDSIHLQGAHWRLALSYFKKQSDMLKVDMKIMNSPFDIKKAKEYFKKNEYGVPSNLDVSKIDPMAQFEVEEVDIELQQQRVNQLNASAANFTNHSFVSFIASVDLFKDMPASPPALHSMICSQKSPVQLLAVENFDLSKLDEPTVSIKLQFEIKQMHSQLLAYISKNFTFLMQEPEIRHLIKDDFKLILKHKHVNVTQEDEVIKAICLWLEGQTLMQKQPAYANLPKRSLIQSNYEDEFQQNENEQDWAQKQKQDQKDQVSKNLVADLNEILQNVNWDYVSLPCMLDIVRNEPIMRRCDAFKQAIKTQFAVRMNRDSQEAIDNAQTSFNCEPRFSYKYNTSQRNLYPTEGDLSFQSREPIFAMPGAKSQFQLLYPVQIYPDFLEHLTDCMLHPIDIVKNWKDQGVQIAKFQPNNQLTPAGFVQMTPSPEEQALESKSMRKRHLQQQLLKKELEMQQIKCQLDAIEILDKLNEELQPQHLNSSLSPNNAALINRQNPSAASSSNGNQNAIRFPSQKNLQSRQVNFGALDDKIQQAKRDFQMRIGGNNRRRRRREAAGQVSDRMHINQQNQEDSSQEDNGDQSRRNGAGSQSNSYGSEGDVDEVSSADEEREIYPEDESEIEEFKVQESRPSVPKKRLSQAVEENKKNQENRRIVEESKSDKELNEEWERMNNSNVVDDDKDAGENNDAIKIKIENGDKGNNAPQLVSKISPASIGQSDSCVEDYAQLQVERKNWSQSVSNYQESESENSKQSSDEQDESVADSSISMNDDHDDSAVREPQKSAQAPDRRNDILEQIQQNVQKRGGSDLKSSDNGETPDRVQLMSMQMSFSERDEVKLNATIRKGSSQRSSNLQVHAALSDNLDDQHVQIGQQVNKQLKAIKESHSNSTDNSNSREDQAIKNHMKDIEIQTDHTYLMMMQQEQQQQLVMRYQRQSNKIHREQEGQTEIDMDFMYDLLEQMNQKRIIEQELQRMILVTNIDKRDVHSQTVQTAPIIPEEQKRPQVEQPARKKEERKKQRSIVMTQENEIVKLSILHQSFNHSIDEQNFTGLNQASSFFNSQDSVSSQSKDAQSVEEVKVSSSSEDDLGLAEIQIKSGSVQHIRGAPIEESSESESAPAITSQQDNTLQSEQSEQNQQSEQKDELLQPQKRDTQLTPRAVEDLVNGKGQIKELTFDIFAILGSEQSSVTISNQISSLQSSSAQAAKVASQKNLSRSNIENLIDSHQQKLSQSKSGVISLLLKQRSQTQQQPSSSSSSSSEESKQLVVQEKQQEVVSVKSNSKPEGDGGDLIDHEDVLVVLNHKNNNIKDAEDLQKGKEDQSHQDEVVAPAVMDQDKADSSSSQKENTVASASQQPASTPRSSVSNENSNNNEGQHQQELQNQNQNQNKPQPSDTDQYEQSDEQNQHGEDNREDSNSRSKSSLQEEVICSSSSISSESSQNGQSSSIENAQKSPDVEVEAAGNQEDQHESQDNDHDRGNESDIDDVEDSSEVDQSSEILSSSSAENTNNNMFVIRRGSQQNQQNHQQQQMAKGNMNPLIDFLENKQHDDDEEDYDGVEARKNKVNRNKLPISSNEKQQRKQQKIIVSPKKCTSKILNKGAQSSLVNSTTRNNTRQLAKTATPSKQRKTPVTLPLVVKQQQYNQAVQAAAKPRLIKPQPEKFVPSLSKYPNPAVKQAPQQFQNQMQVFPNSALQQQQNQYQIQAAAQRAQSLEINADQILKTSQGHSQIADGNNRYASGCLSAQKAAGVSNLVDAMSGENFLLSNAVAATIPQYGLKPASAHQRDHSNPNSVMGLVSSAGMAKKSQTAQVSVAVPTIPYPQQHANTSNTLTQHQPQINSQHLSKFLSNPKPTSGSKQTASASKKQQPLPQNFSSDNKTRPSSRDPVAIKSNQINSSGVQKFTSKGKTATTPVNIGSGKKTQQQKPQKQQSKQLNQKQQKQHMKMATETQNQQPQKLDEESEDSIRRVNEGDSDDKDIEQQDGQAANNGQKEEDKDECLEIYLQQQKEFNIHQIKIDLQKRSNHDSNPADDQPMKNKLHVPPNKRPQSNVNFVTSKLSNLFQAANLIDENDDSERHGSTEKQADVQNAVDEEKEDDLLSVSYADSSEDEDDDEDDDISRSDSLVRNHRQEDQEDPPLLNLKGFSPTAAIVSHVNFNQAMSGNQVVIPNLLDDMQEHSSESNDQQQSSQRLKVPSKVSKSGNKKSFSNAKQIKSQSFQAASYGSGVGVMSNLQQVGSSQGGNSSAFPGAQADLFSKRDEGLACFNILDHLRQNSIKIQDNKKNDTTTKPIVDKNGGASAGTGAVAGTTATAVINLSQLREEHIQQKSSSKLGDQNSTIKSKQNTSKRRGSKAD